MPQIAKLFVHDEEGSVIGSFVVDMESIVELYHRRMRAVIEAEHADDEPSQEDPGTKQLVHRVPGSSLGWFRYQDGSLSLQEINKEEEGV